MKKYIRRLVLAFAVVSLFLTACAPPPPPPVSKDQIETTRTELSQTQKGVKKLENEKSDLEQKIAEKNAEIEKLNNYRRQLDME